MKTLLSTFLLGLMVVTPLLASADDILSDDLFVNNKELFRCLLEAKNDYDAAADLCEDVPSDFLREECLNLAGSNYLDEVDKCLSHEKRKKDR